MKRMANNTVLNKQSRLNAQLKPAAQPEIINHLDFDSLFDSFPDAVAIINKKGIISLHYFPQRQLFD